MRTKISFALFSSFLMFQLCLAQEPCKTAPMQGYTGKCAVTVVQAADGKHFYSSDQVTLKKWDLNTMKVIEEITDFPYEVHSITNYPDVLEVNKFNMYSYYNLKLRADWMPNVLPNPAIVIPKKYKTAEILAYDESLNIVIVGVKSVSKYDIVKVPLAQDTKATVMASADSKMPMLYNAELKWLATVANDNIVTIDIPSGKQLATIDTYRDMFHFSVSPDKKYAALCARWKAYIFETATGKLLTTAGEGEGAETDVIWKSDGSGFYFIYIIDNCTYSARCLKQLNEYSLPDATLVADRMKGDIPNNSLYDNMILDADKGKLYLSDHFNGNSYEFKSFDLTTGVRGETMSLKYEPAAELVKLDTIERANRMRTFNKTIERLFAMPAPAHYHVSGNPLTPGGSTADGTLLIHENEQVFRWKFPEGKCEAVYIARNSPRKEGIGPNPVYVASAIADSYISPSGAEVAFNYIAYNAPGKPTSFEILRGDRVQLKKDDKQLYALLEGKALIGAPQERAYEFKALELIETTTGKTLFKFPSKINTSTIDATTVKDKIFFVDENAIKMFDLSTMAMTEHPLQDAKKIGYYLSLRFQFNTNVDRSKAFPGLKARKNSLNEREQGRYFISGNADEGFDVYDLIAGKYVNPKPLYSGWGSFQSMAYFPVIDQLVVWQSYPGYARPNATKDEPGASAFGINLNSGDITPYLMHLDRQTIIANAPPVEPFQYTPISDCDYAELVLPVGAIWKQGNDDVVKVGFDCETREHVLVIRQRDPQNSRLYSVRFAREKYVHKEGGFHYNGGSLRYDLCPGCGGFPLQTGEVSYTGWTDWEQQNFNIYSRRYVKNKKITQTQVCSVCHGQAILLRK